MRAEGWVRLILMAAFMVAAVELSGSWRPSSVESLQDPLNDLYFDVLQEEYEAMPLPEMQSLPEVEQINSGQFRPYLRR